MAYPFSVTSRKNFPEEIIIRDEERKSTQTYNMYHSKVVTVQKQLGERGIIISNNIVEKISYNSVFYNRMNIYFLFVAYLIFDNPRIVNGDDLNYNELINFIKDKYKNMPENKYNFQIEAYIEKIARINSGFYNDFPYLKINPNDS